MYTWQIILVALITWALWGLVLASIPTNRFNSCKPAVFVLLILALGPAIWLLAIVALVQKAWGVLCKRMK